MTRYAVWLRAVNVGGRKVPMADLRALASGLGLGDPRTLLASGNLLVTSPDDAEGVRTRLERALQERFGFAVECVAVPHARLRTLADACPFGGDHTHVVFFAGIPDADALRRARERASVREVIEPGEGVWYVDFGDGVADSKLAVALPRLLAPAVSTVRNLRTVVKLAAME